MNSHEGGPKMPSPIEHVQETPKERFPSLEAMKEIFSNIFKGQSYKIIKEEVDEQGVVVFEAEGIDSVGDKMELNFQRANYDYTDVSLPAGARFSGSIHAVFYMGDDPCGGECVANYLQGVWYFTAAKK